MRPSSNGCRAMAQAASNAGILAMAVAELMSPAWNAPRITAFSQALRPKSSALTITCRGMFTLLEVFRRRRRFDDRCRAGFRGGDCGRRAPGAPLLQSGFEALPDPQGQPQHQTAWTPGVKTPAPVFQLPGHAFVQLMA